MCEKCVINEISLLKTIKSEVKYSNNKQDALDRINGWILILENAMLCQQQQGVSQLTNLIQSS